MKEYITETEKFISENSHMLPKKGKKVSEIRNQSIGDTSSDIDFENLLLKFIKHVYFYFILFYFLILILILIYLIDISTKSKKTKIRY